MKAIWGFSSTQLPPQIQLLLPCTAGSGSMSSAPCLVRSGTHHSGVLACMSCTASWPTTVDWPPVFVLIAGLKVSTMAVGRQPSEAARPTQ